MRVWEITPLTGMLLAVMGWAVLRNHLAGTALVGVATSGYGRVAVVGTLGVLFFIVCSLAYVGAYLLVERLVGQRK